ncbi:hypothetical protein ACOI1H_13505 [Loktanella sp. DJP18]|uniref:hypothetical protein n=1 Tax=Loktanella sp. DJP18 TaxID=3409788 RepID=UPI003BB680EF
MKQADLQIWNDAVAACRAAAWTEVEAMETLARDGMPNPARSVVRAVGTLRKAGDARDFVSTLTAADFPTITQPEPEHTMTDEVAPELAAVPPSPREVELLATIADLRQKYDALVCVVNGYQNMPGFSVHPMVAAQIECRK